MIIGLISHIERGSNMNVDIIKGKWAQLKGSVQSQWSEITDDEVGKLEGDAKKLSGLIQEKYGRSKDEAEKEIQDWSDKF